MDTWEKVIMCIIVIGITALFYGFYENMTAEKFSLRKDSWTCTESRREPYTSMVGKVVITNYHNVCYNWKKNA